MQLSDLRTLDTLIESLRAAFATEKKLHLAELELLSSKLGNALQKIEWLRELSRTQVAAAVELSAIIKSQQETIRMATADLVILKGNRRAAPHPIEQTAPGNPLEADVDVQEPTTAEDLATRKRIIKAASDKYEEVMRGLNVSKETLAAAIPQSEEAWRDEHQAPGTEELPDPSAVT